MTEVGQVSTARRAGTTRSSPLRPSPVASGTYVYQTARYTVTVSNTGNQTASGSTVAIQLPPTHTSPTVYMMGTLGAKSAGCTLSGQTLTCNVGSIRRSTSTSVFFDYTLPENADPLSFTATAATTSAESNTTNNSATLTPALNNYAVSFTAPGSVLNSHCTGTNLSSYDECSLFPSSISSHVTTLEAGGGLSFADGGGAYTGTWTQDVPEHLTFDDYEYGTLAASFDGYGVSATCWEGMTTFFPASTYMSMYRVCLE